MGWKERIKELMRSDHVPARGVDDVMSAVVAEIVSEIDKRLPPVIYEPQRLCRDCAHLVGRDNKPEEWRCAVHANSITGELAMCAEERASKGAISLPDNWLDGMADYCGGIGRHWWKRPNSNSA